MADFKNDIIPKVKSINGEVNTKAEK